MPIKHSYKDLMSESESGNWNVAPQYAITKIMKWLYLMDEYETIAEFGTSELVDEFLTNERMKKEARVMALKRLCHSLSMLISNSTFAVRKIDKEEMKKKGKEVKRISDIIITVSHKTTNQRDHTNDIKIDEEKFDKVKNILLNIKGIVYEILNQADLIFLPYDDFDPFKQKNKIKDNFINQG